MKAITIHQPWAWAIAAGKKTIENRGWATNYRGPLLIHAGKSRKSLDQGRRFIERLDIEMPADDELPFGAIVAVVRLVACVSLERLCGDSFAEGPYCWKLADARPVEPSPYTGEQGLFNVPDEIVRRLVSPDKSRVIGIEPSYPSWKPGALPLS